MGEIGTKTGFVDRGDPAGYDFSTSDFTTDSVYHNLDLSSIIPKGTKLVLIRLRFIATETTHYMRFRKKGQANSINIDHIVCTVANLENFCNVIVAPNQSGIIEYSAANTTFTQIYMLVRGWWL